MKWWQALLVILAGLSRFLDEWRRQREAEQRQAEQDRIDEDPAGAFDEHFNGRVRGPAELPDDADQAPDPGPAESGDDTRGRH